MKISVTKSIFIFFVHDMRNYSLVCSDWALTEKKQIHFLRKAHSTAGQGIDNIVPKHQTHKCERKFTNSAQFQAIQASSRKSISKMKHNEITLLLINCKGFKSSNICTFFLSELKVHGERKKEKVS